MINCKFENVILDKINLFMIAEIKNIKCKVKYNPHLKVYTVQ